MKRSKPRIGLLLGDSSGIGPELVVKTLNLEEIHGLAEWVVVGDKNVFKQARYRTKELMLTGHFLRIPFIYG
jgi:4-hydroxy-L-threonine phosphate dehydrogenase PdxA